MKTARVLIQLTPEEKMRLEAESKKTGLSMSTVIRLRISDIIRPVVVEDYEEGK